MLQSPAAVRFDFSARKHRNSFSAMRDIALLQPQSTRIERMLLGCLRTVSMQSQREKMEI